MVYTEEDIIKFYTPYIKQVFSLYANKWYLEYEDAVQIAYLSVIRAIRTYKEGITTFKNYMQLCVYEDLRREIKYQKEIRRCHYYAVFLDKEYCDRGVLNDIIQAKTSYMPFYLSEVLYDFNPYDKSIILGLAYGYSKEELIDDFSISAERIDRLIEELKNYFNCA